MGCLIQLGLVGNNRRLQQTNSAREEGTTKSSMLGTPLENYIEAYQASLGFLNSNSLISIGTSSCTDCHGSGRRSPMSFHGLIQYRLLAVYIVHILVRRQPTAIRHATALLYSTFSLKEEVFLSRRSGEACAL